MSNKPKDTKISTVTSTTIYLDRSVTPLTGKDWKDLKHAGNYEHTFEKRVNGKRLVLTETMPVRNWYITGYDENNNKVFYEDSYNYWFEQRYHPVAGHVYYKDSSNNYMVKDISKDGRYILSYRDSKGRILVHNESTNFVIHDKKTNTFIHNSAPASDLPIDKFEQYIKDNCEPKQRMRVFIAVKLYLKGITNIAQTV